jgi:hypothetical protein
MKDKGVGGFQMKLVITKCSLRTINPCNHITPVLMRGDLLGVPDLHGFTRFEAGNEDEHKEHDEHDEHEEQIEGKLTHTRYTPVVLIGPIHQLNRITRKRLQE